MIPILKNAARLEGDALTAAIQSAMLEIAWYDSNAELYGLPRYSADCPMAADPEADYFINHHAHVR